MNRTFRFPAIAFVLIVSVLCAESCKKKPTPPAVTTTTVSAITHTGATSGGNVTSDGGAEVTAKGVCWNTSVDPTILNSKTSDGKGTGSFTSTLSQLTPGTPYYLRAYATNEAGTGYGNPVTFTTSAITLATVITTGVSVTGTTAVVGGNITSDGGGQITARGICWGTTANPTVSGDKTTEGTGTGVFSSTITGLSPGVNYFARAYATNSAGVEYGDDVTFTPTGGKPSATTGDADPQTGSYAILYGTVNPNWAETAVTFEYGLTASYGQAVTAYQSPLAAGNYDAAVHVTLDGLEPGKTYHFRIKAVNSLGTTYSTDKTFTSRGDKPSATTGDADPQTGSYAILYGTVNPNWAETAVTFEYGLTASYGQTVTAFQSPLAAGNYDAAVHGTLDGLEPGKTYHFRIKAVNSLGTTYSTDKTFTSRGDKPTVTTGDADPQTGSYAILYGTVNPNWAETTVTFEYGLTASYGQAVTAFQSPLAAGNYDAAVHVTLDGLEPGKTYHFRIKAVNSLGTTYSTDKTFTSRGDKPSATTGDADPQTGSYAILYGTVNPNWAETAVTFEYGLTASYGQTITAYQSPLAAGNYDAAVHVTLDGLEPGKTYHFRIKAVNSLGTTYGADKTFTTPGGK